MTVTRQTVMQTLNEASWAPRHSAQTVSLLERAVREADVLGDAQLGFRARADLLQAAFYVGALDKAMACYGWMLGQADTLTDAWSSHQLLWLYKWVAGEAAEFPEISRDQLVRMLDDMEARYRAAGSTLRPVLHARAEVALSLYELEDVRKFHARWQDTPRDHLSDCVACEMSQNVLFYAKTNRDEQAVNAAEPLLYGKRHSCTHVPHLTFAYVLLPLVRLGRFDEAARCHREGYRLIQKLGGRLVDRHAEHLQYLTLTNNLTRGIELFEKHLPAALAHACAGPRMRFFATSALLFDRIATARDAPVSLKRLPIPSMRVIDSRVAPGDLAEHLSAEARSLAQKFDRRNGHAHASAAIEHTRRGEILHAG